MARALELGLELWYQGARTCAAAAALFVAWMRGGIDCEESEEEGRTAHRE